MDGITVEQEQERFSLLPIEDFFWLFFNGIIQSSEERLLLRLLHPQHHHHRVMTTIKQKSFWIRNLNHVWIHRETKMKSWKGYTIDSHSLRWSVIVLWFMWSREWVEEEEEEEEEEMAIDMTRWLLTLNSTSIGTWSLKLPNNNSSRSIRAGKTCDSRDQIMSLLNWSWNKKEVIS